MANALSVAYLFVSFVVLPIHTHLKVEIVLYFKTWEWLLGEYGYLNK